MDRRKTISIDKKLFDAWKKGDINARNKVWVECLDRLFRFTLEVCGNQEDTARDIFHNSIQELDSELKKGKITWKGEPRFYSYLKQKIKWRAKTALSSKSVTIIMASNYSVLTGEDEEELTVIDTLADGNTPEEIIQRLEEMDEAREKLKQLSNNLTPGEKAVVDALFEVINESTGSEKIKDLKRKAREWLGISENAFNLRINRIKDKMKDFKN